MEPFYMTYPMQNLFQAEMEYEKDLERMKELYPKDIENIMQMISERCDELEYEGSRIYDENPDRMMMMREAEALYEKMKQPQAASLPETMPDEAFSLLPPQEWRSLEEQEIPCTKDCASGCDDSLCSIISILFYNEIYKRRCRYRRCRRWW